MYHSAKVLGQIFANPPYYILRCVVASEVGLETIVVKGNIPGPVNRGFVFTFQGKKKQDKNGKMVFDARKSPVNPKWLKGTALTSWSEWSSASTSESVALLGDLIDSGVSVYVLNELWKEISQNPKFLRENPWILVESGVSFKDVDAIAKSILGSDFDIKNPHRVEACVYWSLSQGFLNGHCFLDADTVFRDVSLLTGTTDPSKIKSAISNMMSAKRPRVVIEKIRGSNAVYLPPYHNMESEVANRIKDKLSRDLMDNISEETIRSYTRYELTDTQIKAIQQGIREPLSIVTGLPGTGKTTILSTLCKILQDEGEDILLIAPTGIAAKRANSLTGVQAYTIHRAFGAGQPSGEEKEQKSNYEGIQQEEKKQSKKLHDPRLSTWKHNAKNPRTESVVIIDESSMVDLHLMWRIMNGISDYCRVILVGDIAQLPPVGAGFILSELIKSGVPRTHLTEVFRQGEGSGVTKAAHEVHAGVAPESNTEFEVIHLDSEDEVLSTLVEKCKDLQMDEVDFHVMSPTHHGTLGVTNLNRELRSALNPDIGGMSIKIGKNTLREGDRVMITKNDYDLEVFNGDVGKIASINKYYVEVSIKGVQDSIVSIPRDRISKLLRLAYATTVHKSQGLEYDVIFMPLSPRHSPNLLKRSLLYTAITRAKEKVYLIGDSSALEIFVYNNKQHEGYCGLSDRIRPELF